MKKPEWKKILAPEDRWSAKAAALHRSRLAAYREGELFVRQKEPGNRYTSDVLLAIEGEPLDRFVTKMGGLPYRPASIPWPRIKSGEPRVFLGQICFADSLDLVGELPGDVLLVFTSGEHDHTVGGLHYEWYPLGIEGLVSADAIPDTPWWVFPCYMRLSRHEETEEDVGWPKWMTGAKIGGRPYWIQEEPYDPGEYLASFASVDELGEPDDSDLPV